LWGRLWEALTASLASWRGSDLPPGTMIPAAWAAEVLASLPAEAPNASAEPIPQTWRERLWLVPGGTRLGAREAAEAVGRPVSWVYRRTGAKSQKAPLPCRRLDGELVFTAGELRAWMDSHETVVAPLLRKIR
jgi:hypothetical protein